MSLDNIVPKIAKAALVSAILILMLVPFHAFLTVWLARIFGHYTALRLWSLVLLVLALLCGMLIFWRDKALRAVVFREPLAKAIVIYICIQLVWGLAALLSHHVTAKALGYGWIVNVRFLIFFLVTWVLASKTNWLHRQWPKLVFWPAAVVIIIGLLQYFVLPYDFLKHFGYSAGTIYPYETINHNIHHIRVMSTLRGANPLGAYLVVVLSLVLAKLLQQKQKRLFPILLGLAGLLVLVLSFSRGAWVGMVVAVAIVLWQQLRSRRARQYALAAVAATGVIAIGLFIGLRNNLTFQDAIFHTNAHSTISSTSDQGHASALKSGLRDVLREPLGRGPGTAGPASEYNTGHPVRIAENYFIQIAQETGWLGLVAFVAVNVLVALKLWAQRSEPLALGLFAALVGVSIVSLLSHAWTDDTLAFIWWGLAGIAIAVSKEPEKNSS